MKCTYLLIVLLFVCVAAQDYTMGTREHPKADLAPDEKLVIQTIVILLDTYNNIVCPRRVFEEGS